jgi:hypothetical protein
MGKVHVIGEGLIPEIKAFDRLRESLQLDYDVYLGAMWAKLVNAQLPEKAVIYNTEPLYDGCRAFSIGYLEVLKTAVVLDYRRKNVDYLKTHGIEAHYLPYGYHKSLERFTHRTKHIDVLLVGSHNPRREQIVDALRQHINVVWVTGAYGEELDYLLSVSRVVLNIHYIEEHPLEVVRLNYLLANGCTVVSERSDDEQIDNEYADGLYFADDLQSMCLHALAHPKNGYDCIRQKNMDFSSANAWVSEHLV